MFLCSLHQGQILPKPIKLSATLKPSKLDAGKLPLMRNILWPKRILTSKPSLFLLCISGLCHPNKEQNFCSYTDPGHSLLTIKNTTESTGFKPNDPATMETSGPLICDCRKRDIIKIKDDSAAIHNTVCPKKRGH